MKEPLLFVVDICLSGRERGGRQGGREGWQATMSDKVKVFSRAGLVIYGILGSYGDGLRGCPIVSCLSPHSEITVVYGRSLERN